MEDIATKLHEMKLIVVSCSTVRNVVVEILSEVKTNVFYRQGGSKTGVGYNPTHITGSSKVTPGW